MAALWRRITGSARPEVSILIPAYEAATFIDRTLYFARGQTFTRISILVSVDAGVDATPAIVERHAGLDRRIRMHVQKRRLGWAGNVNFLLEHVETPYFFIYFHDDILLPQYTERLLNELKGQPEAVGIYCDMGHFGATDHVSTGPSYHGAAVTRLLTMMLSPERGSPLRAMLRTEKAHHLRLPELGVGGFWANEPFLLDMAAAGPLEHLPETLYLRWNRRADGLTEGWKTWDPQRIIESWKANIETRLDVLMKAARDEAERKALVFALYVSVFPGLRNIRDQGGDRVFRSGRELNPAFATPGSPELLAPFGLEFLALGRQRFATCGH